MQVPGDQPRLVGSTTQYDGTPADSYRDRFTVRSKRRVLGDRISTASSGRSSAARRSTSTSG